MRIELPHEAEWIIGKIRERGFEAFVVGGCVRDSLLGRTPGDWDITTSATPEQIKAIFGKTVDTGLQHGTVTVIKNHMGYEVTTYRIDGEYRDGRHPDSVEFTKNLIEDLKRRDFTINAMAYSYETGIVDAFDGMGDLDKKIIRCVGRAHDRFLEDALRILRAVRFAAQLGFSIEEETWRAVGDIAPNLIHVSRERIQTELTKLLLSGNPEKISLVHESGMSPYITGSFTEVFEGKNSSAESIKELLAEKSLRWAGFLRYLSPEAAKALLKELRLDNETVDNARAMIQAARTPLWAEKTEIRRFLSRYTPYQFEGALRLKELDGAAGIENIRVLRAEILADGDCTSLKMLAVSGSDLLAAGIGPGKAVGETLNFLLDQVLQDPGLNQKETLLSMARKHTLARCPS